MDTAAELGRNPVSKHKLQPEYGDKQADGGRDCRNRLVRNSILVRWTLDFGMDSQQVFGGFGRKSWYRPGSVRLDTRRLNKVNTSLVHSEKDRRRKEEGE